MNQRLIYCDDGSAPCTASKTHTFTDYITTGTCTYCNLGVRTRSALAALRKEVTLTPDINPVPDEDRERIREEWRKHTKSFQTKRRLREDFMTPVEVKDIDEQRLQCTYCWRQFDGMGDDCCENPRKLFCGHTFGYRCILDWLFYSGKHWCPTCRKGFDKPREGGPKNKRHGMIIDPEGWPEALLQQFMGGNGDMAIETEVLSEQFFEGFAGQQQSVNEQEAAD